MGAVLLGKRWACPNCDAAAQTFDTSTPMHHCPRLAGLYAALVPEGVKARVTAVEREDYIGKEQVQFDANGRPVMAIVTERDDGQDCTILAPLATPVQFQE